MILIVSEETGAISVARGGVLNRNLDSESLRKQLDSLRDKKKPQTRRIAKRTAKKTAKETSKKRRSKA
jgi:diadenylate cyclase